MNSRLESKMMNLQIMKLRNRKQQQVKHKRENKKKEINKMNKFNKKYKDLISTSVSRKTILQSSTLEIPRFKINMTTVLPNRHHLRPRRSSLAPVTSHPRREALFR